MSKRMNWRNARLSPKRSLSVKDEAEYRGQDAAARWLERADAAKKGGKVRPAPKETAT